MSILLIHVHTKDIYVFFKIKEIHNTNKIKHLCGKTAETNNFTLLNEWIQKF